MNKLYLTITAMVAICATNALAYDFTCDNSDGKAIYYNRLSNNEVEVTYQNHFRGTESYCGHLIIPESVTVGNDKYTVTAIGDDALFNCRELASLSMPNSLKSIGAHAFAWCDAISEITIPKSVQHIGNNTFDGCYALTEIKVARGNGSFTDESGVLYTKDLSALVAYTPASEGNFIIPEGVESIDANAFAACTFLTDVTLPESLKSIGDNAFYFCNFLSGINIPANVNKIGHAALSDCISLEYINVDPANTTYSSVAGVLYDKDVTTLLQNPGGATGLSEIPATVKSIGEEAFFRNHGLTTIKIPESVTEIGEAAFTDCRNLTSVEIPTSVTKIGAMALAMCPSLTSLYVDAKDPKDIKLGDGAFVGINPILSTLYVPKGSESLYAQAPQWSEFKSIVATDGLKEQTIDWSQQVDTLLTESRTRLIAQSSSKLPVYYALNVQSQELATIYDRNLIILAPGTITVTAYQPGNIDYRPAKPITRTFKATTAIIDDAMAESNIKVYGTYGAIVIKGAEDSDLAQIYDIKGMEIYSGYDRCIPVSAGNIYIVRIAGHSYKVAVMQ